MKESRQDRYYLEVEGNDYFKRNFLRKQVPKLRNTKALIRKNIIESGIKFTKVLEYGCNYGDLLYYMKKHDRVKECVGVEASKQAVDFGKKRFGENVEIIHGTIADNIINDNKKFQNYFDLIIVDDVFGWISRETILQSIANIDNVLSDGGHIFIRDFYPDKRVKNRNHHVKGGFVFNFKILGSHASIFLASGIYEVVWQRTFYDNLGMSTKYKSDNKFIYRWTDVILRKSYTDFFTEDKKIGN